MSNVRNEYFYDQRRRQDEVLFYKTEKNKHRFDIQSKSDKKKKKRTKRRKRKQSSLFLYTFAV